MNEKEPKPLKVPLKIPPHVRDVTKENLGTMFGIVGVPRAPSKAMKPNAPKDRKEE